MPPARTRSCPMPARSTPNLQFSPLILSIVLALFSAQLERTEANGIATNCPQCIQIRFANCAVQYPNSVADQDTCTHFYCGSFCTYCTTGKYTLSGVCVPCPINTYQPALFRLNNDITSCLPCPTNTYTLTPGSAACLNCTTCAQGNYTATPCQPGNDAVCKPCRPGYYNLNRSAPACTPCAPGTYQPNASATACTACPSGTIQPNASAISCLTCTPGTYAASVTDSACTPCPPGTYQPNASATACTACPAGLYQPNSSTTSCLACPSGQYQPLPAHTTCLSCPLGTFQPYNASTACTSCPACPSGTFLASGCHGTYNATCKPCKTCSLPYTPFQTHPTYSNISQIIYTPCSAFSDTVCGTDSACPVSQNSSKYTWMLDGSIDLSTIACRAGQYLSGLNPKTCLSCPAWLVGLNGIYCEPCGPLQTPYSVDQASCVCVPPSKMNASGVCICPDGYHTDASACTPCRINTYGASGSSSCTPCLLGYYAPSTATACTLCGAGLYRESSDTACRSCGVGMYATRPEFRVSCTQCATSCPDGYRADPCPGETNTTYMVCSPCDALPDNAKWDNSTECGYKCNPGYYRGNQSCLACNVTQCDAGYNLTKCTEFANGNCDTPCVDDTKPRLFSQWGTGCSWSCNQGYSPRTTDYWIFKIYDCVPG